MRKKLIIFPFAFLLSISLSPGNDTPKFSLKLSGGMSWLKNGGDINDWFNGEKAYFYWLGKQQNYSTKSNYFFKKDEPEGNFEVIFRPFKNFGVGLGIGYMRRSWSPSSEVVYDYGGELGNERIDIKIKNELNVFPVTLSVLFTAPISILKVNLLTGGGYYFANVRFNMESIYSWPRFPGRDNYKHSYSSSLNTHLEGIGFHVGAGVEAKILSFLSISVDAIYRSVKLGDIKGSVNWNEVIEWSGYKSSSSGNQSNQTLWLGSMKIGNEIFKRVVFSDEKPEIFESTRPFRYNLDGVFIKAGIVFSF
ncbi:MAG: hypothetical protein ACUVUG_10175 [Candidatus Aminicenantia bacterium]